MLAGEEGKKEKTKGGEKKRTSSKCTMTALPSFSFWMAWFMASRYSSFCSRRRGVLRLAV